MGIDSISLNDDSLVTATKTVLDVERRLRQRAGNQPHRVTYSLEQPGELLRELSHPGGGHRSRWAPQRQLLFFLRSQTQPGFNLASRCDPADVSRPMESSTGCSGPSRAH